MLLCTVFFWHMRKKGGYKVKKVICSILTIVLVLGLIMPTSFAAIKEDYQMNLVEVMEEVEETNEEIEELIQEAIEDVEEVLSSDKNEKKQEKEIDKIIRKLVKETDKIAGKTIKNAAKKGIIVLCEYVEVTIGNRTVLIDPLRVVSY